MIISNLVETHSHILPAIDDGAPDLDTSLAMISRLKAQGAEAVILTPHYYSDSISLQDFLDRRDNAFELLKKELKNDSIRLIPAAEVYISSYLFNYESLDGLKIGSSDYILLEHSFSCDFGQECYDRILSLNCDYGVKPILAHIERYSALMENEELLDEYLKIGCLVQANVSSFADAPRAIRKKLFKYLDSGRIHFIGSDCHNLSSRAPSYEKGIKEIIKKSSKEAVELLEKNANLLIK